jgi:hypothetical protein
MAACSASLSTWSPWGRILPFLTFTTAISVISIRRCRFSVETR